MNIPKQTEIKQPTKLVVINQQGFGKNTNQALQILIASGLFDGKTDKETILAAYSEWTKTLYKQDLKTLEELKNEL